MINATVYDFSWDDQGDLGVWVQPAGTTSSDDLVCIEAQICVPEGACYDDYERARPTGDYILASCIELALHSDGIVVDGQTGTLFGSAARAALARLQEIEKASRQVAVNEQQAALGLEIHGDEA